MHEPLVSVILPTYRRPNLLTRAIASVLAQTYPHWEILVVDDNDAASPGRVETEAFMRRHAAEPRIRYLKHDHNQGLSTARNTGIQASSGPLVAFLDDDDAWAPEKLRKQVELFLGAEDVVLVYTGLVIVDTNGHLIRNITPDPRGLSPAKLLEENWIRTPSSVMCRRCALVAAGLFDARMPSLEDWDLYLRLSGRFAFVDEQLTTYYLHDGGRMMDDSQTLVRASEIIYQKNRGEFIRQRGAHAAFLRRYARLLRNAGDKRRSRRFLGRSLSIRPLDRLTVRHLLELELGEVGMAALRNAIATLRVLFRGPTTPSKS